MSITFFLLFGIYAKSTFVFFLFSLFFLSIVNEALVTYKTKQNNWPVIKNENINRKNIFVFI